MSSLTDRIRARLPKHVFLRNLTIVAGGSAAGQALSIAAAPVLSRIYQPSDFGILAIFGGLTTLGGVASTLCYHLAIPISETDEEAATMLGVSAVTLIPTTLLVTLCSFLLRPYAEVWFQSPGFAKYLWFVPFGVVGLGAYEVASQWAARRKAFGLIGRTTAMRSALQVFTQIGGGLLHLGAPSLITSQLVGQWSGISSIFRSSWQTDAALFRNLRWRSLWLAARRHRRFPLFSAPATLLSALEVSSSPLLFAHFFGSTVAGYFALGDRMLTLPISLIANSAQKVFFPAAAIADREGRLAQETAETLQRLLPLVLPAILLMVIAAPEIFSVGLGARWKEAGVYTQWIACRMSLSLVIIPLLPVLFVRGKQSVGTIFHALQLVFRVAATYVGSLYHSAHLAVALLGVCTASLWFVYLGYILIISGNRLLSCVRDMVHEAGIAALLMAPVLATKLAHLPVVLVAATAFASVVWTAAFVVLRARNAPPTGPASA